MTTNNTPNNNPNRDVFLGKTFGDDAKPASGSNFWNSLKRNMIRIIVWTIVAFILLAVFNYIRHYRVRNLQTAFLNVKSTEQLKDFANEFKKEPLAGVALVRLADLSYTENNFPLAAAYYREALEPLKGTELEERAQIGLAISLLQNKDTKEGEALLTEMSQSPKVSINMKAQALYQLFILSVAQKNYSQAHQLLSTLSSLSDNNPWADKAGQLAASISELQNHSVTH